MDKKAMIKKEQKETPEEEAAESPEEQAAEKAAGVELHSSTDEVPVSEEFQRHAHKLVGKANRHHLSHLRSKISNREDELSKGEEEEEKFTVPSDLGI